jgi:hypothetical protein
METEHETKQSSSVMSRVRLLKDGARKRVNFGDRKGQTARGERYAEGTGRS